ncbi:MAG: VCBS repeat-containing protein [Desulforhopalus sp.]
MRVTVIAVTLFCITLNCVGSVYGEEGGEQVQSDKQYKIVFSIFDRNSAGNYAYLRDSIQAMLASRLAAKDRVDVLEKTFSEDELNALKDTRAQQALSIGGENADYLVTGALFALTGGLEVQVDLYPLIPEQEILHFSVLSKTQDTLIADVEQLSRDIAQTAFGYVQNIPGAEQQSEVVEGTAGFVTAHPEAAYKKNVYSGSVIGVAGSGVITKGRGAQVRTTLPVDMRVMAVGDVTGDGEKDILILAGSKLKLFKLVNGKVKTIQQVSETTLPSTIVSHAVNLADLDGDGKEEIYISGTDGLYVSSMILKYHTSDGFQVASRHIPWYIRPLRIPGKGWQLAGQKRGIEKIALVSPGIYLLTLDEKNKVEKGDRLPLPTSLNLFDFAYADLDGDGFHEIVAVDQKEKLRVYNPGNELMWVSQKNYGGSKIYLGPSQGGAVSENDRRNFTPDESSDRELIFVPGRIITSDIDGDGKEEIVLSEGKKAGLSFFRRLRFYDSGAIVSMAWNGAALTESWRTGDFRGYVAGYGFTVLAEQPQQIAAENDDAPVTAGRLFVGHLPKSGSLAELLPGGGETEIAVYDLEFSHEKKEELN